MKEENEEIFYSIVGGIYWKILALNQWYYSHSPLKSQNPIQLSAPLTYKINVMERNKDSSCFFNNKMF